jgi:hypothetical protein
MEQGLDLEPKRRQVLGKCRERVDLEAKSAEIEAAQYFRIEQIGASVPAPILSTTRRPHNGEALPVSLVGKMNPPASACRSKVAASLGLSTTTLGSAPSARIDGTALRIFVMSSEPICPKGGAAATIWLIACASKALLI